MPLTTTFPHPQLTGVALPFRARHQLLGSPVPQAHTGETPNLQPPDHHHLSPPPPPPPPPHPHPLTITYTLQVEGFTAGVKPST